MDKQPVRTNAEKIDFTSEVRYSAKQNMGAYIGDLFISLIHPCNLQKHNQAENR